jgi:hypothetical protein
MDLRFSVLNIVKELLKALLGNGSVNTATRNNRSSAFHCYAAASAPMNRLGSDHVGTPTDTHATIAEACFLCVGSVQKGF